MRFKTIMEDIKKFITDNKLFSKKEIETLKYSQKNKCYLCENVCGSLAKLNECKKNNIICLNCLDCFHDNYNKNNKELFICICCNNLIYSYEII